MSKQADLNQHRALFALVVAPVCGQIRIAVTLCVWNRETAWTHAQRSSKPSCLPAFCCGRKILYLRSGADKFKEQGVAYFARSHTCACEGCVGTAQVAAALPKTNHTTRPSPPGQHSLTSHHSISMAVLLRKEKHFHTLENGSYHRTGLCTGAPAMPALQDPIPSHD